MLQIKKAFENLCSKLKHAQRKKIQEYNYSEIII